MAQKLRVPVATLLTKVEAFVKADAAQLKKEMTKYEADLASFPRRVAAALKAEAKRIEAGGAFDGTYNRYWVQIPERPSKPQRDGRAEQDLALLKATVDEGILVDPSANERWTRYL